ncbi:hypothetical protein [Desulfoferula mesophila]|uniref:Uncharacterized protein n=1 Tax=Desulfoferula mesophila TaxID=3058419 RepID=A0AAU9EHF5_9BACT|nr:hypothetical protein FAK_32510 [Desulfoferula mesophilus]
MIADSDNDHIKTVYAEYGLAIYLAQCLEHGIANALIYLDLIPRNTRNIHTREEWADKLDSFMNSNFEQTLGRLIYDINSVSTLPTGLRETLAKALKKRNWLAHDYSRERATEFMTASGRNMMIQELQEVQELFQTADELLDSTFKPVREKYGFTDNMLETFYKKYFSSIKFHT